MSRPPEPGAGLYEARDALVRPLFIFVLGLVVLIAVSFVVASWMTNAYDASREEETHPLREFRDPITGPLLQANPSDELIEHRAWEQGILEGNPAWIDSVNGVVRIPIERAMELTVERGLPVREGDR